MLEKLLVLSVLCAVGIYGQAPDVSGCELCKQRYSEWFVAERINASSWTELNDTKLTADNLCSEAQKIYYDCFMKCVKDANGHELPLIDDLNSKALEIFLTESCMQHECRLADTLVCSIGSGRGQCLPETMDCNYGVLKDNGCNPTKLCHEAERQAYAQSVKDRLNCFLNYPDFVVDGLAETDERRRGLQVCKDIVMVGCLPTWHQNSDKQDFKNFITFDDQFKEEMCREESYIQAVECLTSATNGTVTYANNEYEEPCNVPLIKEASFYIFQSALDDLVIAYDYMCSPYHCQGGASTEQGASTEEPSAVTGEPLVVETTTETPEVATEASTEEEHTETEQETEEKKEETDSSVDKPAETPEDHSGHDHSGHDHHDHEDHHEHQSGKPGPVAKSPTGKSENKSSPTAALSLGVISLIMTAAKLL